jgi:hypothetical protein
VPHHVLELSQVRELASPGGSSVSGCQGVTRGQCVRNISVWHERHKHTLASGAAALGISRASYSKYLHMSPELVPRTVMLACVAMDEGLEPIGAEASHDGRQ